MFLMRTLLTVWVEEEPASIVVQHIISFSTQTKVEGKCDACGADTVLRDDDKPETVQKRLAVYHEQTQPLIEYYDKQGILKSVDGTKPMDEVFSAIVGILGE